MNILMVGSVCNVGCNLKVGLEELGHSVTLVSNRSVFDDYGPDFDLSWWDSFRKTQDVFDIVHIHSPNLKKFLVCIRDFKNSKLVCHWHGSDLRVFAKCFPVKSFFLNYADAHIYSTIDLAWWIPVGNKYHIWCPVDTDLFRPNGNGDGVGEVIFDGGAKSYSTHRVHHNEMPGYLNRFSSASIHNAYGLDDHLMSVIALECISCGLSVKQFPLLDRKWVEDNASISVVAKKIESIYREVLDET